jgi:hypothetical protein
VEERFAQRQKSPEEFRGFTSCLSGARQKAVIYGTGAWNIGDIRRKPAMAQA